MKICDALLLFQILGEVEEEEGGGRSYVAGVHRAVEEAEGQGRGGA